MKKIVLGIVIGAFAFSAWQRVHHPEPVSAPASTPVMLTEADPVERPAAEERRAETRFRCDGRTHCSHMTSCEEATFFLQNCPNVKMDGNNDGVPCEKQWCRT